MPETNPIDAWGNDITSLYGKMLREANEANPVPLGQERLSTSEAKKRFVEMSEPERQRFIAERGEAAVLDMLRGK